ncbi:plasmid partition ParA protein [Klebsiella pneumoniae]|uniref:Plasmid partition ParA protein n=1 Tax=Klebsiella pneumoniae TaxID=573 RepID=A0A4P0XTD9_KLEPN|nr:plasmid partition ParA protein [Klebsiella pneumoniae]
MLLTQLRYFGFHFNPVNFYYCYDEADTLRWVLAEVRNTPWNERSLLRGGRPAGAPAGESLSRFAV